MQHPTVIARFCRPSLLMQRQQIQTFPSRNPSFCVRCIHTFNNRIYGNAESAGQQYKSYLQYLNSKKATPGLRNRTKSDDHKRIDPQSTGREDKDDSYDGGSTTETEVEAVKQLINELQSANSELQSEMDHLVAGLADLVQNIKHKKVSDKHIAALDSVNERSIVSRSTRSATSLVVPPTIHHNDPSNNEVVTCVMQHPGILCCIHTSTTEDPNNRSVTVRIETTATATDDDAKAGGLLAKEEIGALAAQALLSAAAEQLYCRIKELNAHTRPVSDQLRHDELCAILQSGTVIDGRANPVVSQFGHESFVVLLQDEVTGRVIRALFKPRVEGDADGWHRVPMEWVAYKLNLLLGMDYVPPVAYRTGGIAFKLSDQDEEIAFAEGSMMFFVEDAHQLRCFPESQWGSPPVPKEILLSNTRILDNLLNNSDRHHGHFLLGRHWCRGVWSGDRWVGELQPCLIDHAASFRADAEVNMMHENAFKTGAVQSVAAETYLRLRFLDYAALSAEFHSFLTEEEIRGMVRRRDQILRYLDGLVAEQGYASTVRK